MPSQTAVFDDDLEAANAAEVPDANLCLKIARRYAEIGQRDESFRWLARVTDTAAPVTWLAASNFLQRLSQEARPPARRALRAAVTSSYTTSHFVPTLQLAALRTGIALSVYESPYGQYQQELLDPRSGLYGAEFDYIIIATDARAVELPSFSSSPDEAVATERERWTSLWAAVSKHSRAVIIQHNFAIPLENAFGHLSARVAGARATMLQNLNLQLGAAARNDVVIVDCERMASQYGKERWFDDRYWYFSKQAVSFEALPTLARHTAAVLAAAAGMSRKCLVLDLDNTLWGGVIGEDGLAGIDLGRTPAGEAHLALQEYILELKSRGVILAVVSKNNESDARQPFTEHPDMRIRLDDLAVFVADWNDKAANIREVAKSLNLGLDALVLLDDNPAERQMIRHLLPEVEVVSLPSDPSGYVRALADSLWFEASTLTQEDLERTRQYRARAQVAEVRGQATTLDDFYGRLRMEALVEPFTEVDLPRIVQLISKTNQFNLTTRRHSGSDVRRFMQDAACVTLSLRLRDSYADHGLVAVLIARKQDPTILEIDTLLMSCRVIGRTVEDELLMHLCRHAESLGCSILRGTFVPSSRNEVVRDLFERFDFSLVLERDDGSKVWDYDLAHLGPIQSSYIHPWSTNSAS